ncbi:hypothetical protein GP486_006332, partial [Trichoglossum hirsutum]
KNNYIHHIGELASKALKAAGSMINVIPTPRGYQSQSLRSQEMDNIPVLPPVEPPNYTLLAETTISQVPTRTLTRSPRPKESRESLPPAYDTLSRTSQRSSLASISSTTQSSVLTLPTTPLSRTSVLSPASPSASSSADAQHNSIWTASPSVGSSTSLGPKVQTLRKCIPDLPTATSPQESDSPITSGVKRSSTWTPSTTLPSSSPAVSLVTKLPEDCPGRRHTVNSASNRPVTFGNSSDDRAATDITSARGLRVDDTNSMVRDPSNIPSLAPPDPGHSLNQSISYVEKQHSTASSPLNPTGSKNPWKDHLAADDANSIAWSLPRTSSPAPSDTHHNLAQWINYVQKQRSATGSPLGPLGSNIPEKDYLAADEALAKRLQQEEYRDIQMGRDQLLAYSIANGTATYEDVELAYFMSRETLIASTEAVAAGSHNLGASAGASFDPWGVDSEALQMQLDWLEARKLEKELKAQDSSTYEASLSEAKRLQAQFDKEAQHEEEWEEWKKRNIEECIICGDEHHGEELLRPCEHGYCEGCLQDGFKNALSSKTPFRCCKKALSIESCPGLSTDFVTEYEEMMLELSTPNPMYCWNPQCASFLAPRVIVGDVGTCEKCRSQTCRHCRQRIHPGTFCKEDKDTEAVKDLAKAKGWKTCPGCNHLIERFTGCLHMICTKCQTAFCYRCSKPWRDCESTCPDR